MRKYRELLARLIREEWRRKDESYEAKMRLKRKAYGFSFEEMCISENRKQIRSLIQLWRYVERSANF